MKDRGRFSEALEQFRLVEQSLVEEFRENYLEWLPSYSKRAREALQALQDVINRQKPATASELCFDKEHCTFGHMLIPKERKLTDVLAL